MTEQSPRSDLDKAEMLDVLSAIWILACNDENPAISYRGIRHRLRLSEAIDERRLVAAHGELFRLTIPTRRLELLKARYRLGTHLPSWLREMPEEERAKAIDELTVDDYFRSQFRAERDASRAPLPVVDWGLQHIDRLRKASHEVRDERLKRWSSFWIPLVSTLVALIAVGSSAYLQVQSGRDQRELKRYEVGFRPKADGYARFMQALTSSFNRAATGHAPATKQALDEADLAFIQLEPFLAPDDRDRLWGEYQQLIRFVLNASSQAQPADGINPSLVNEYLERRQRFREDLYRALFN